LPVFALFNATVHLIAFIGKRKYNPGLIVSAVLNYPLGIYALWVFNSFDLLDAVSLSVSIAVALVIHLCVIFYAVHRYRTRLR
jgi:hypothetical protein